MGNISVTGNISKLVGYNSGVSGAYKSTLTISGSGTVAINDATAGGTNSNAGEG
jgi:hypothetical protein